MTSKRRKLLLIGIDQAIMCLLKKFINKGIIPNIEHLVKNGVLTEAYPCPPCDTPTNWTTIATGATTAVHGATSFYLHIPGEPLNLGLQIRSRTQLSRYCKAEYLWDVADRQGLIPFVINYPGGWPSNFIKGAMSLLTWPIPESLPRMISPSIIFTFTTESSDPAFRISKADILNEVAESYSIPLQICIKLKHGNIRTPQIFNAYIIDTEGNGYNALTFQLESEKEWKLLKSEVWSSWISLNIDTMQGILPCLFKSRILELAKDGSYLKFQLTSIYNTKGWTIPESLGEEIVKNAIVYEPPKEQKVEYMISGKVDPYLLFARGVAQTLARAIYYLKKNLRWHICFFHIHLLDSVNHKTLAYLYEKSPFYTEEAANKAFENVETAYKIVDELIENLMKLCVDKDTIVILVSDHGAVPTWRIANIPLSLMNAGLISYKWNSTNKKFVVDWDKTLAFPYLEPPYIWVNLKGREPHGIVSTSQYDSVRDEIIQALSSMKDHETGDKIVNLAIKREDADFLGQNGERIGDVIYFLNPPYQIFDGRLDHLNAFEQTRRILNKAEAYNAKRCFGAHAYYLPSAKLGEYTISAPLILNGPGLKKDIKLKKYVNLIDIAPTLAHLLGISKPKDSVGRVIEEALE